MRTLAPSLFVLLAAALAPEAFESEAFAQAVPGQVPPGQVPPGQAVPKAGAPKADAAPRKADGKPANPGAQSPAEAAAAGKSPSAAAIAEETPLMPTVTDPMLEPVPAADQSLGTWEEVVQMLKARSIELRLAYAEVKRAEGQWRVALASALTTINVNGVASHYIITPGNNAIQTGGTVISGGAGSDTLQLAAQVQQPLFNMATWHNIGTAQQDEDVAKLSVEDVKRTITTSVANAVVAVVVAERVAELNRVGLRNALERLALSRARYNLGTQTALDVARARQDVEASRATLVNGDESLRQAREALGLAVGSSTPVGVKSDIDLNGLGASVLNLCTVVDDVNTRPDIAVLRGRIVSAERRHDNVKLQFVPTLNLASSFNMTASESPTSPANVWSIQGVLNIPLWEGGARYGNLKSTEALWDTAEQNLEGARRRAINEVRQTRRLVTVAETALKVAVDSREQAAEVDRLQRVSFQEGRGTSLELVAAAASLRQADITLAQRELDLVRARILSVLSLARCSW